MLVEFWWVDIQKRDCLEDLSMYVRLILNRSCRNRMGEHGLDLSDSGLGQVAGYGEERSEL